MARATLGLVIGLSVVAGSLVFYGLAMGWQSASEQEAHVQSLRERTTSTSSPEKSEKPEKPSDDSAAQDSPTKSTDVSDPAVDTSVSDDTPINELQVIGTHNSYITEPTWLQMLIIGAVEPSRVDPLRYSHPHLSDQFDSGIRSIELDLRNHGGQEFAISHAPLTANRGNSTDFGLALKEIDLWSDAHPFHSPITVLVEFKEDYVYLDPAQRGFDAAAFDELDVLITDTLGDSLLTPDDVRGSFSSVRAAVVDVGWPTLGATRGKVSVVMYENEAMRSLYLDDSPTLEGKAMFTSSHTGQPDAAYVIEDDPASDRIAALVAEGYIVRTRSDTDLVTSTAERDRALGSGAQIVSTDFPASEPQAGTGYSVGFGSGVTVRRGPHFAE